MTDQSTAAAEPRPRTRYARLYADGGLGVMPAGASWEEARRNLLDSSDDDDTELLEIEITVIRTHGRPKLRVARSHSVCCPTCGDVVHVEVPHDPG